MRICILSLVVVLSTLDLGLALSQKANTHRNIELDPVFFPDVQFTLSKKGYTTYNISMHPDVNASAKNYKILISTDYVNERGNDEFFLIIEDDNAPREQLLREYRWETSVTRIISINANESWSDDTRAALVATIYYEVNNTQYCESNDFKCRGSGRCDVSSNKKNLFDADAIDVEPFVGIQGLNEDVDPLRGDSSQSGESRFETHRCISSQLRCNNIQNCGISCYADEDSEYCYGSYYSSEGDGWYDIQYLLTILLAGLFFILSPICIVIFLFYHRRLSAARYAAERQQRVLNASQHNNAYNTGPENDLPPSYDELQAIKRACAESEATSTSTAPAPQENHSTSVV